jgi:hypothetical protein
VNSIDVEKGRQLCGLFSPRLLAFALRATADEESRESFLKAIQDANSELYEKLLALLRT